MASPGTACGARIAMMIKNVFLSVLLGALLMSCSRSASFALEVPGVPLEPVSSFVSGGMQCFSFTVAQQQALRDYVAAHGDAAVQVTIAVRSQKRAGQSGIGFLYAEDFSAFGLAADRASHPQVSADFSQFARLSFSVAFCLGKSSPLPAGFYVRTDARCTVLSAKVVPARVGFDFREEVPLFAFAPNGGTIEKPYFKTDFTGVPLALNTTATAQSVPPQVEVHFRRTDAEHDRAPVVLTVGGERLTVRPDGDCVTIPCAALKSPFSPVTVDENEVKVAALFARAGDPELLAFSAGSRFVVAPIRVDPGLIMAWGRDRWRGNDYELFEWDRFPGVLFFDTASYAVQDDFFRRLAYFVEKAGYRGRLMSDDFLAGKHGYNAHDYRAESLAAFFEAARAARFPLNKKERLLYEILVRNGVVVQQPDGSVGAGSGAVISVSQESSPALRRQFVAHEGWHGIFFVDDAFRNTVASIYYTIDPQALAYLKRYFQVTPTLGYDVQDDYLMKNEFMAYMLERPVSAIAEYYVGKAKAYHSQTQVKSLADYIIATGAEGFVSASTLLDEYVDDRWNLAAGRVWLISR